MVKGIITVLTVGVLTTGCVSGISMKSETSLNDISVTSGITMAQEECYRSDAMVTEGMDAKDILLATAIKGLRDTTLAALGKPKCSIVTVYDSQIAEVTAKTEMTTKIIGSAASVLTNGIIGASVVGLVGNSGNEYETSGFGADIVVADKSNNDPAIDSYNPATVNTTTTTGVAE